MCSYLLVLRRTHYIIFSRLLFRSIFKCDFEASYDSINCIMFRGNIAVHRGTTVDVIHVGTNITNFVIRIMRDGERGVYEGWLGGCNHPGFKDITGNSII